MPGADEVNLTPEQLAALGGAEAILARQAARVPLGLAVAQCLRKSSAR